ncbi:MAG: PEP-CTERM sorting domain-containing protein [Planctomycetaceae bacterium]
MSSNTIRAIRIAVAVVASLALSTTTHAFPVSLTQAQFNTAAGGSAVVEDFEGFMTGDQSNPFVFANGRYSTPGIARILDTGTFGTTKILITGNQITDLRTFDLFPVGTTLVGMDLFYISPLDLFDIMVTGGSGVLNISQTGSSLGTFLGVQDPLGITSITFSNPGQPTVPGSSVSNYSFDNIQTASGSEVPEPASVVLFGLTALGMGVVARRRRKQGNPAEGSPVC